MDAELRKRIRKTYKEFLPVFLREQHIHGGKVDPYIFDFEIPMTPIESNVWGDIRYLGLPFFMQVPAGPYFIDFADPIKKIGIEVDGKKWHVDIEKDAERESHLTELGWVIIRIPGHMTFKNREDFYQDDYDFMSDSNKQVIESAYRNYSSEGILLSLRDKYYANEKQSDNRPLVHIREVLCRTLEMQGLRA